jgi:hypothetical protein
MSELIMNRKLVLVASAAYLLLTALASPQARKGHERLATTARLD